MGVDINTFRCRIGTFQQGSGQDVILLRMCLNYTGCLKMVGAVTFIGLLLLMACVESNPGPLDSPSDGGYGLLSMTILITALLTLVVVIIVDKVLLPRLLPEGNPTSSSIETALPLSGSVHTTRTAATTFSGAQTARGSATDTSSEAETALPRSSGVPTTRTAGIRTQTAIGSATDTSSKAETALPRSRGVPTTRTAGIRTQTAIGFATDTSSKAETALQRSGGVPTTMTAATTFSGTQTATTSATSTSSETDMSSDTIHESFDILDKEQTEKEILEAFTSGGLDKVKAYAEEKLNEWKNTPVKVGVTGKSGAGKSSFINAIRDVTAEDKFGAAVSVTESTMDAKCYPHPDNRNLMLYDLPGAGTPEFPQKNYFTDEKVGFDNYDLFIIITSNRFTEIDLWLSKEIKKRKKMFIFVRSKVDQDISNDQKSNRSRYTNNQKAATTEVIQQIRQNCKNNLKDIVSEPVYLIDSYEKESPFLDFGVLIDRMVKDLTKLQRDAFVLTIPTLTPGMIEAKKVALRRRMYKVGLLSALSGAIPIPGVSFAIDVGIVLDETIFYRKQLGLDEESLRKITNLTNSSMEILVKVTDLKSAALEYTPKGILTFCDELAASESFENFVALSVPILGSMLGGAMSYSITVFSLEKALDMMVNDSKKVNDFVQNQCLLW